MSRLEPWQLDEGDDALGTCVDGVRVAWTLDNDVYIYAGRVEQHDPSDYHHIGILVWDDEPEYTAAQNENHNEERLHEFVRAYLKRSST